MSGAFRVRGRWLPLVLGLAAAGVIRLGLAFWRGSDRVEALLIVIVTFAVLGVYYFIFYRGGKVNS